MIDRARVYYEAMGNSRAPEGIIQRVLERVSRVPGIAGVVLGGSRAAGTHTPESDYDIGLIYAGSQGFDLEALRREAASLDDEQRSELVTPIGGWGPWVVGGGWLHVDGAAVDLIYRDSERIERIVDDCRRGVIEIGYQPAHTVGYLSSTYMAELDACRVLWDPSGKLTAMKSLTQPYPVALTTAILGHCGWIPEFALDAGRKSAPRADVPFSASLLYFANWAMCQMLLALNERYCLNDKGATALVQTLPIRPSDFEARVQRLFSVLAPGRENIEHAFELLAPLVDEVNQLITQRQPAAR